MDDDEREEYATLPDRLTIYRGCGQQNKAGFSWTLENYYAASCYPFDTQFATEHPLLLSATVAKSRIAALKLRRSAEGVIADEADIIIFGLTANDWKQKPLTRRCSFSRR